MKIRSFMNKFVLIAGLVLASQGFAAWDGVSTEQPRDTVIGGKTFYLIENENQLAWFAAQVNKVGSNGKLVKGGRVDINAKLMADLDMIGPDGERRLWTPIGAGNNPNNFKGIFDGNKHIVSNIYISAEELIKKYGDDKDAAQNVGFIGCFSGTVKDLILENIEVHGYGRGGLTDSGDPVDKPISIGTVVGWQSGTASMIDGCFASGVVVTSGDGQAVGGIVGNIGGGIATNCVSTVSIKASGLAYVGGIAGYTKNFSGAVTVSSCVYAGTELSAEGSLEYGGKTYHSAAGAIVGHQYKGKVTFDDLYYDSDLFGADGGIGTTTTGNGSSTTGSPTGVSDVNSEDVVCALNGGTMDDGECSEDSPWSVGQSSISLNGSDGFTVTFNAKSGEFPDGSKKKKIILKDKTITSEEISTPVHADSAFAGWSLSENATEPDADLGSVSGNATVYAVWYPIYTITFSAAPGTYADGVTIVKTVKVAKGDMISVTGMEVPATYVRNDSTLYFTGWSEEQKEFKADDDITASDTLHLDGLTATGDVTFYAAWTKAQTFTVTYNANGHGKTKIDFVNVEKGQTLTEPPAPTPDNGYEYSGWCLDVECNTHFNFETTIDQNYTLYADWNATSYSITYNLNGGTNNADNPPSYTIEDATIVLYDPVRVGYTFKGWFYDVNFTDAAKQITHGSTGAKTLYAKWEETIYEVTYMAGSGAVGSISPAIKKYGKSITLADGGHYDRDGFTQDGWATEDGGEKVYELGGIYTANADLTLYPHWVEGLIVTTYGAVTVYTYADEHKEAVIDGASEETITIPEDIEVTSVTYNRSFTKGKSSTIVLPFDIAAIKVGNAKFYKPSSISSDYKQISFDPAGDAVVANTPYIVIAEQDGPITFEGPVTLKASTALEVSVGNWVFKGSYAKRQFAEGDPELGYAYGFVAKDVNINGTNFEAGKFVKAGKNAWLRPMRAYLVYNGGSEASKSAVGASLAGELPDEINVVVQDEQGNVVERGVLNTRTGEFRMDRWYDLQGRRLKGEPKTQGTYYHNGKRVIVK